MNIGCGFCGRQLPVSARWRWRYWAERRGEWFQVCREVQECIEAAATRQKLNRMEALL